MWVTDMKTTWKFLIPTNVMYEDDGEDEMNI